MDRRKTPAEILAADYKARGIDRQEAWSRFVQDRYEKLEKRDRG